ncbi:response regulator [Rhodobacteraceae bacterium GS-10]|uniref:histidine kinase n=2 Tax=Thalassovita mangrovi TaxID=2692236 RepID=A0A6L8LF94_9RHOB|nr:response regulator [Thalassovita mangrovi]
MGSTRILMAIAAISFLLVVFQSIGVISKVRDLRVANGDNVQWALGQAENEFLKFQSSLIKAADGDAESLATVRHHFNILYSRVDVFEEGSSYDELHKIESFEKAMTSVHEFLAQTTPLIDASDAQLTAGLNSIEENSVDVARNLQQLSITALNQRAEAREVRRKDISSTLLVLTATSTLLMGTLLLLAYYFNTLTRRSEERRRQVNEAGQRTRAVISTALDAVIVTDAKGIIEEFNNAAVEIFGYSHAEAIGRNVSDLIVPDQYIDSHDRAMKRIDDGGPFHIVSKGRVRLDAKRSNGEVFPIELALQKSDLHGRRFFIAFIRDISFRVRAEQDLIEARDQALAGEKAKARFLAVMSHEIRTPLNGLMGNLSLLQETPLSGNQQGYVDNMSTSGKLLMDHINDVLDIARYEAGKPILRNRPTDLQEVVDTALNNLKDHADKRGNTIHSYWLGPRRKWVKTDPGRIQQILINLVSNAIKFTKDGEITVEVIAEPGTDIIEFKVADTGMGISEADLATIFDDFVTSDSAYNREAGGTGLGLGIVKRITSLLGGELGVDSRLGEGSTFWVKIPMEDADAPIEQAPSRAAAKAGKIADAAEKRPTRKLDILVVEDNEINRNVVRAMLQRDGHRISEAPDGQSGVARAAEKKFDLILMDISMPVLDGREATRRIRSGNGASSTTPIIALTAHVLPENVSEFMQDGMQDVLPKPLMRQDLERIIATYTQDRPEETDSRDAPPMPAAPGRQLINPETNTALRDSLGEGYDALRLQLTEELTELVEWLQGECDDMMEIAARCHKHASSAALFGAEQMRQALIDIEIAGKKGDNAVVSVRREMLPALLRDTLDALDRQDAEQG